VTNDNRNYKIRTRKGGSCDALQLEAARGRPVVLGFNYEAHDTPVYKLNNSATSADQYCTVVPNFSAIGQCTAELLVKS